MLRLFFAASLVGIGMFASISYAQNAVPKTAFLSLIEGQLPARLCASKAFSTCFPHVTNAQCLKFMTTTVKSCSNDVSGKYSSALDRSSAIRLSGEIGQCAGTKYQLKFDRNPAKTNACILRSLQK